MFVDARAQRRRQQRAGAVARGDRTAQARHRGIAAQQHRRVRRLRAVRWGGHERKHARRGLRAGRPFDRLARVRRLRGRVGEVVVCAQRVARARAEDEPEHEHQRERRRQLAGVGACDVRDPAQHCGLPAASSMGVDARKYTYPQAKSFWTSCLRRTSNASARRAVACAARWTRPWRARLARPARGDGASNELRASAADPRALPARAHRLRAPRRAGDLPRRRAVRTEKHLEPGSPFAVRAAGTPVAPRRVHRTRTSSLERLAGDASLAMGKQKSAEPSLGRVLVVQPGHARGADSRARIREEAGGSTSLGRVAAPVR